MPTPKPMETKSKFVSRCIPIVLEDGTAKDDKQAVAICYSMWEQDKKENSDMSNVNLSADINSDFIRSDENPFDFELIGYTGKVMEKSGWRGIFNMEGMESKNGKVIILREHARDRIVGFGETFKDERGFGVRGKFSKTTKDGIEVAGLLSEGVPLQCSVGIAPVSMHASKAGETINNFAVPSGLDVWDKSYVGEVSVCSWGVDTDTSVHSFAKEIDLMEDVKEIKEEEVEMCDGADDCENAEAAPVEEAVEEVAVEEVAAAEESELKFSAADIEAAVAGERTRIASIFSADAPVELTKKAIIDGMSEGDAFKFFWESEKGIKASGLAEMAEEAPVVEVSKSISDKTESKELSYMDLISQVKTEQKLSSSEATKYVIKHYPEVYKSFIGA